MNLTLISRFVRYVSLVVVLVAVGTPAPADVISNGDVDPGGAGTQPDPWAVGGDLKVGNSGNGTLNVTYVSVVYNTNGYIGRYSGSKGVAVP